MAAEVIWLPRAELRFAEILEYLLTEWTAREATAFIDKVDAVVRNISLFPELYLESELAGVRQAVVTKHTLVLYRVLANRVELLTFSDTRRDPARKFEDV